VLLPLLPLLLELQVALLEQLCGEQTAAACSPSSSPSRAVHGAALAKLNLRLSRESLSPNIRCADSVGGPSSMLASAPQRAVIGARAKPSS